MKRILAILPFLLLTACPETAGNTSVHIGDAIGPPGAKVYKVVGDDWYVIQLENRLFLYRHSTNKTEIEITSWPEPQ